MYIPGFQDLYCIFSQCKSLMLHWAGLSEERQAWSIKIFHQIFLVRFDKIKLFSPMLNQELRKRLEQSDLKFDWMQRRWLGLYLLFVIWKQKYRTTSTSITANTKKKKILLNLMNIRSTDMKCSRPCFTVIMRLGQELVLI